MGGEACLGDGPGEGEDAGAEDGLDGGGDGLALGEAARHGRLSGGKAVMRELSAGAPVRLRLRRQRCRRMVDAPPTLRSAPSCAGEPTRAVQPARRAAQVTRGWQVGGGADGCCVLPCRSLSQTSAPPHAAIPAVVSSRHSSARRRRNAGPACFRPWLRRGLVADSGAPQRQRRTSRRCWTRRSSPSGAGRAATRAGARRSPRRPRTGAAWRPARTQRWERGQRRRRRSCCEPAWASPPSGRSVLPEQSQPWRFPVGG